MKKRSIKKMEEEYKENTVRGTESKKEKYDHKGSGKMIIDVQRNWIKH